MIDDLASVPLGFCPGVRTLCPAGRAWPERLPAGAAFGAAGSRVAPRAAGSWPEPFRAGAPIAQLGRATRFVISWVGSSSLSGGATTFFWRGEGPQGGGSIPVFASKRSGIRVMTRLVALTGNLSVLLRPCPFFFFFDPHRRRPLSDQDDTRTHRPVLPPFPAHGPFRPVRHRPNSGSSRVGFP